MTVHLNFIKHACRPDKKGTKPSTLYELYRDYAARFKFPTLNVIRFGKQLSNLGTESRESNGTKFWLVSANMEEEEIRSRTSLTDAMDNV